MIQTIKGGVSDVGKFVQDQRKQGRSIGFVPTMGYLHQGHLSLIEASKRDGHCTVMSIFVNPTQFGPNEDFDAYPRDEARDLNLAEQAGADAVWFPTRGDLYPQGDDMRITPGEMGDCLCGISRPVFFSGILTVVMKLFHAVKPDCAYFGEKDFQQLTLIRRMTQLFFLDVRIVGCPTVREIDGLAMSSRNVRIPPDRRNDALGLFRTIQNARKAFLAGQKDPKTLRQHLLQRWPDGLDLDYLEFRDPQTLNEVTLLKPSTRIFIGAWLDGVRLIDNAEIGP